jgi:hypothetical protein
LLAEGERFIVGLAYKDSLHANGYLYTVTPSRKPGLKITFPVDDASFKKSNSSSTRALAYADATGQIYYVVIFNEQPIGERFPATLAKIYRSDGLAWSNNYDLSFRPNGIIFKPETSELTLKDDSQQTLIDKNGKVVVK